MQIPRQSTPGKGRIIELDFVRGIAILLVMGYHFVSQDHDTESSAFSHWCEWFFGIYGPCGVDLFFVLSGFLVGGLLIKELAKGKLHVSSFLIRRAFKIWPSYYFYLAFIVATGHHPVSSFLLVNSLHVQNYFPTALTQTWSLAVEEHFYLVLPLLLSAIWDRDRPVERMVKATAWVCVVILAIRTFSVYYLHQPGAFAYTHTRLDALMFGVLVSAIFHLNHPLFNRIAHMRLLLLGVFSITLVSRILLPGGDAALAFGVVALYVGSAAFLLLVLSGSAHIKHTALYRLISWIGLYSYGIFLWHNSVRAPISQITSRFVGGTMGWWVAMVIKFVAGITLGMVASKLVEWPFIRLRDKWFPRKGERSVTALESYGAESRV